MQSSVVNLTSLSSGNNLAFQFCVALLNVLEFVSYQVLLNLCNNLKLFHEAFCDVVQDK